MVTLVIGKGKDKETFLVYKEHACRCSPVRTLSLSCSTYIWNILFSIQKILTSECIRYLTKLSVASSRKVGLKSIRWRTSTQIHFEFSCNGCTVKRSLTSIAKRISRFIAKIMMQGARRKLIPQLQNEAMTLLRSVGRTCIEPFEMWADSNRETLIIQNTCTQNFFVQ